MLLKDFEDTLKNIENDRMLMSYGNNQETVNNILSIVNIVQSAQSLIKMDRAPDMFAMSVSSKLMELENLIVTLGYQRLMERGINVQSGMRGQFHPMTPNMPIYNQPMPQFMPQTPPQMPQYYPQQQQQYMQQQPMQQPQQAAPPPPPPPAAPATPPPAPASAPTPPPAAAPTQVVNTAAPKPAASAASMGALPGMGGGSDEKAAGRDFLLKLLSEK